MFLGKYCIVTVVDGWFGLGNEKPIPMDTIRSFVHLDSWDGMG